MQIYVKVKRFVQVKDERVLFRDVAEVWCAEQPVQDRINSLTVHRFAKKDEKRQGERAVISSLKLVRMIEELYASAQVDLSGEPDILVERIRVEKTKGPALSLKILFVCLVTFFGTGFTIMAYHNDIGIVMLFREVYHIFMGEYPKGPNVLEVCYSIGLSVGIIVFYNHIGRRRITKDPTPMEVAMYEYEQSVDYALIELADRQGMTEEADS